MTCSQPRDVPVEVWNLERILLLLVKSAADRAVQRLPRHYYGFQNSLGLYLHHSSYSPFLPLSKYDTRESGKQNIEKLMACHKAQMEAEPDRYGPEVCTQACANWRLKNETTRKERQQ